jgi:lipoprotein NlpI
MRAKEILVALALAVLSSGTASAQDQRNARLCNTENVRLDLDLVIRSCTAVIDAQPSVPRDLAFATTNRGIAYARTGQHELAIKDFDRAIEVDATYAPAFNHRGHAYGALGELDRALADFNRAIELDPDYNDAYLNRGDAYVADGNFAKAIENYDHVLARDPDDFDARITRAAAYEQTDQYERAVQDYDKAVTLHAGDPAIFYNRGRLNFYRGLFGAAADDFARSAHAEAENPYFALWLHMALARDGREAESKLGERIRQVDMSQWPAPLLRRFAGTASVDEVMAGTRDRDPDVARGRVVESDFYLGQQALIGGDRTEATRRFRAAVDSQLTDFVEHRGAKAELDRMAAAPR